MATEIRLAFALNGGVSLAIWIGGVADEVLRAIHGGRLAAEGNTDDANPWAAICAELDVAPKADVLTGTSAGGLNAAFLAAAVTPRLHRPQADPRVVAAARLLRHPDARGHRQLARLAAQRRRPLPAPHRGGLHPAGRGRHRLPGGRAAGRRTPDQHVAAGQAEHPQGRPRLDLVGRPPGRVRLPRRRLRLRRRPQQHRQDGSCLSVQRVVPGGLRAQHGARPSSTAAITSGASSTTRR